MGVSWFGDRANSLGLAAVVLSSRTNFSMRFGRQLETFSMRVVVREGHHRVMDLGPWTEDAVGAARWHGQRGCSTQSFVPRRCLPQQQCPSSILLQRLFHATGALMHVRRISHRVHASLQSWYANENAGLAAKLQDKGVHLALFFNAADTERSARARAYYATTARMQTWSHGAYAHKVRVSDESTGWLGRTFGRVFNAFSLLAATNAFTALASLLGAPPRSSLRSRESTRTPLRRSG